MTTMTKSTTDAMATSGKQRKEGGEEEEEEETVGVGALARYNSMGNLLTKKDTEDFVETLQV